MSGKNEKGRFGVVCLNHMTRSRSSTRNAQNRIYKEIVIKNIRVYHPAKYDTGAYKTHEENIYEINGEYVTSIMFEQEPEYGENQPSDALISQYPLEDILEEFYVVAGDMYPAENKNDPVNSYIEFSSPDIGDIQSLLQIVGKHVYNQDNGNSVLLMIE